MLPTEKQRLERGAERYSLLKIYRISSRNDHKSIPLQHNTNTTKHAFNNIIKHVINDIDHENPVQHFLVSIPSYSQKLRMLEHRDLKSPRTGRIRFIRRH